MPRKRSCPWRGGGQQKKPKRSPDLLFCTLCEAEHQKNRHLLDCLCLRFSRLCEAQPAGALESATICEIGRIVFDQYLAVEPDAQDFHARLGLLKQVEDGLRGRIKPVEVVMFGSSATGMFTKSSDMDLALQVQKPDDKKTLRNVLGVLQSGRLRSQGTFTFVPARVPIITFTRNKRSTVPCNFDIACRMEGVQMACITREFVRQYPLLVPLNHSIQLWAANRGFKDSKRSWLSSHAILLMLIHYLLHVKALSYSTISPGAWATDLGRAESNLPVCQAVRELRRTPKSAAATYREVGDHLVGFLRFYGYQFDFSTDCVCLQPPGVQAPHDRKAYGVVILDPVNPEINVARVLDPMKAVVLKDEFRLAFASVVSSQRLPEAGKLFLGAPPTYDPRGVAIIAPSQALGASACREAAVLYNKALRPLLISSYDLPLPIIPSVADQADRPEDCDQLGLVAFEGAIEAEEEEEEED